MQNSDPHAARRAAFSVALTDYMAARRAGDVSRSALGDMRPVERRQALLYGLAAGAIRRCRLDPRADPAEAVAAIIACLADNTDGACSASVARIARVLNRTEKRIWAALARLADDGRIVSERRRGRGGHEGSALRWLAVPTAVTNLASPAWILDALAEQPASRRSGGWSRQPPGPTESVVPPIQPPARRETNPMGVESKDARVRARGFRGVDPGSVEGRERREAEAWLAERAGGGREGRELVATLPSRRPP